MKDVIYYILPLVLAVPIGVISNLITPYIKNWWAKSSVKRARKRIDKLNLEFEKISQYFNSKEDLIIYVSVTVLETLVRFLISSFASIIFVIFTTAFPNEKVFESDSSNLLLFLFAFLISYSFGVFAVFKAFKCSMITYKVIGFEKYKLRLEKLKDKLEQVATYESR